jgi:hypothetical protein
LASSLDHKSSSWQFRWYQWSLLGGYSFPLTDPPSLQTHKYALLLLMFIFSPSSNSHSYTLLKGSWDLFSELCQSTAKFSQNKVAFHVPCIYVCMFKINVCVVSFVYMVFLHVLRNYKGCVLQNREPWKIKW